MLQAVPLKDSADTFIILKIESRSKVHILSLQMKNIIREHSKIYIEIMKS